MIPVSKEEYFKLRKISNKELADCFKSNQLNLYKSMMDLKGTYYTISLKDEFEYVFRTYDEYIGGEYSIMVGDLDFLKPEFEYPIILGSKILFDEEEFTISDYPITDARRSDFLLEEINRNDIFSSRIFHGPLDEILTWEVDPFGRTIVYNNIKDQLIH